MRLIRAARVVLLLYANEKLDMLKQDIEAELRWDPKVNAAQTALTWTISVPKTVTAR